MSIGSNIGKGLNVMIGFIIIVTAIVTTIIVLSISYFTNSDEAPEVAPKNNTEQTK